MKKTSVLFFMVMISLSFLLLQCQDKPFEPQATTDGTTELAKGGVKGGGGGGNGGGDTEKGDEFGDLYILWRNADGAPICTLITGEHGTEAKSQPIAFNGVWEYDDEEMKYLGVPDIDYSFPGEYFFEEAYAYSFWEGYYNIGVVSDEMIDGNIMGDPDDDMVVPYNTDGDLITDGLVPAGVEIGRKNLARAPESVLDNALKEVMKTLVLDDPDDGLGGSPLTIDYCGRLVGKYYNDAGDIVDKTVDSPRENMALYKYIMENEGFGGAEFPVAVQGKFTNLMNRFGAEQRLGWMDIAASCFAAAGDKTDNLYVDEVVYTNTFLGLNGEGDDPRHYDHYADYNYDPARGRYDKRWIKVITLDGVGGYTEEIITLNQAVTDGKFAFTLKYNGETNLAGFRTAADDATQVLDYIHGDSNMEWIGHGESAAEAIK